MMIFYILAVFIGLLLLVWCIQLFLIEWSGRARKPSPSSECSHRWRSITPPYVRQCKQCGALEFREDQNGAFPDGLREWLEVITRPEPDRTISPKEAREIVRKIHLENETNA